MDATGGAGCFELLYLLLKIWVEKKLKFFVRFLVTLVTQQKRKTPPGKCGDKKIVILKR